MRTFRCIAVLLVGSTLLIDPAQAAEAIDSNGRVIGTVIDSGSALRTEGGVSFLIGVNRSGFSLDGPLAHGLADCSDEPRLQVHDSLFPYRAHFRAPNAAVGYYPAPPYQSMTLVAMEFPPDPATADPCAFAQPATLMPNGSCCVNSGDGRIGTSITAGTAATFDTSEFIPPFSAR